MYICLDCYKLFEIPKKYTETHGLDEPPYEKFTGCPYCGGTYVEAKKCDICNSYITNEYIVTKNGNTYCEDCYNQYKLGEE